jgi:ABC-2 type transport system permease protein
MCALVDPDLELVGSISRRAAGAERRGVRYRIYRLDAPMQPGEARSLAFRTRREQVGFRASGAETAGAERHRSQQPGADAADRHERCRPDRGSGHAPQIRPSGTAPFPRLDDLAATRTAQWRLSWTTADITVSTAADQIAVAPGRRVSERVRTAAASRGSCPDTPINNFFSIQSGRYAAERQDHGGVEHSIYYHPAHHWNVDRMMTAMRASIDYYSKAFGPYQFDQARIVETPAYGGGGGQAFPNTIAVGEGIFAWTCPRSRKSSTWSPMLTAHELAHQWWGHQVRGQDAGRHDAGRNARPIFRADGDEELRGEAISAASSNSSSTAT